MRKTEIKKRLLCGLLGMAAAVSLTSCAAQEALQQTEAGKGTIEAMEPEEAVSLSFDIIGGSDVMPIMGFYGPTPAEYSWNANALPDLYSDEVYELIKETGINIIGPSMSNYATVPQYSEQLLSQADKYGLGAILMDKRYLDPELSVEQTDSYISDYANHKSFLGAYLVDEPGTQYYRDHENGTNIDEFKEIAANLNELDYFFYGNLLGMEGKTFYSASDTDTYYRYVREWVDTVHPKTLMYDRYIFGNNKGLDLAKTYFKNMEIIRKVAEEENIPFWVFVEAGNQWNDAKNRFDSEEYYPSQGEFYWNIGTLLAFGAKGVMYFPLIQPYYFAYAQTELFDFQRNGLIGAWNNKTRWFSYAQAMNAQVAAVDEVLMNSVNKGVIASGEAASEDLSDCEYLMEGTAWRELTGVKGDAMIGCFNYQGKTALYVVNYDIEYAQKITLSFSDIYNMSVVQDAETSYVNTDSLELTLQTGDSALVVIG